MQEALCEGTAMSVCPGQMPAGYPLPHGILACNLLIVKSCGPLGPPSSLWETWSPEASPHLSGAPRSWREQSSGLSGVWWVPGLVLNAFGAH